MVGSGLKMRTRLSPLVSLTAPEVTAMASGEGAGQWFWGGLEKCRASNTSFCLSSLM